MFLLVYGLKRASLAPMMEKEILILVRHSSEILSGSRGVIKYIGLRASGMCFFSSTCV
jgi:hypothetical protein